jgi:hypothetical protein
MEIKIKIRKDVKFPAFKAVMNNGKLMDAKFTQAVDKLGLVPKVDSIVIIPEGGCNVSYAKEYPVLWISQVTKSTPVADTRAVDVEKELHELFGPVAK